MLERILVPLDGSGLAARILTRLRRLLSRDDAEVEVCLLHVAPRGAEVPAAVSERLERQRLALGERGARATVRMAAGDPATAILEAARELEPSLIALSTHGATGVARFVRGSVAERVLRRSRWPVLLVSPFPRNGDAELRVRRLLLPLDGSEPSTRALPLAAELAHLHGSELLLVQVVPLRISAGTAEGPPQLGPSMSCEDAAARLEAAASTISGVSVRWRVLVGDPAPELLRLLEEERIDLIALTSHGPSTDSPWAFGAVAEHLLRQCRCPALVVRTAGLPEEGLLAPAPASAEPVPSGR